MGLVFLLVIIGGIVAGLGFLTGVVLFIVGLAQKKRRLWLPGLASVLASFVIGIAVVAGIVVGGVMLVSDVVEDMANADTRPATEKAVDSFAQVTGMPLPAGSTVIQAHYANYFLSDIYMKIQPGPDFEQQLRKHAQASRWDSAQQMVLPSDQKDAMPWWQPQGPPNYEIHLSQVSFNTYIFFDKQNNVAWLHAVEYSE